MFVAVLTKVDHCPETYMRQFLAFFEPKFSQKSTIASSPETDRSGKTTFPPLLLKQKFLFMSHSTHAKILDQLILHSFIRRGQAVKFPYFGIYSSLLLSSCLLDSHFVISKC